MRVLHLSAEYPPRVVGGLGWHVYFLTRHLARQECQVTVLAGLESEEAAPWQAPQLQEESPGLNIYRCQWQGDPQDFLALVNRFNFHLLGRSLQLVEQGRHWDLIHAHDWLVGEAARTLKHALHLPLVATIHATEYGRNHGIHTELQRRIHQAEWNLSYEAWRVIACSRYMAREIGQVLQVPADKIDVIPNGVELPPTAPETLRLQDASGTPEAAELGSGTAEAAATAAELTAPPSLREDLRAIPTGAPVVLFVGRLVYEKGVQVLLEALPRVWERFPGAHAVVIGSGPMAAHLAEQAHHLPRPGQVHFAGFVEDAVRDFFYRRAQVAVFPSLYEPFGLVALEAMAWGTPVVASDTGGLGEVVVHRETGLKAWPGHAESLAWAICQMLASPQEARRLAGQALKAITENYTWDGVARQTQEVYRRVLQSQQAIGW